MEIKRKVGRPRVRDPIDQLQHKRILNAKHQRMFQWAKKNNLSVRDLTPEQRAKFMFENGGKLQKRTGEILRQRLIEQIKNFHFVQKKNVFEIADLLQISTDKVYRLINESEYQMKKEFTELKNNTNKFITNLNEQHQARTKELWKITKENEEPFPKIASLKELRESDRDHSKFLQSIGILNTTEASNDDLLSKIIDRAQSLKLEISKSSTATPRPIIDVELLSDHLESHNPKS